MKKLKEIFFDIFVFIIGLIALSGFYQVYKGNYANNGSIKSEHEIDFWILVVFFQSILYISTNKSNKVLNYYKVTQLISLVALVYLVFITLHFGVLQLLVGLYALCYIVTKFSKYNIINIYSLSIYCLLLYILVFSGVITYFLFIPTGFLQTNHVNIIAIISLIFTYGLYYFSKRSIQFSVRIHEILPISFLLVAFMRTKISDISFDSYLYKATHPYHVADWLNYLPAAFEHSVFGSSFMEIINGLIIHYYSSYYPPLASSLSFFFLFILIPVVLKNFPFKVKNLPVLSIIGISSTEIFNALGTAYHETAIYLLMFLALMPGLISVIFLQSSIYIKITAAFSFPFYINFYFTKFKENIIRHKILFSLVLIISILMSVNILKNVVYTGRLISIMETLSSLTDPNGKILAKSTSGYSKIRGGNIFKHAELSLCNIALWDIKCSLTEGSGSVGFHSVPSSKFVLLGVIIFPFMFFYISKINCKKYFFFLITFFLSYILYLSFAEEGRQLVVLSVIVVYGIAFLDRHLEVSEEQKKLFYTSIFFLALSNIFIGINNKVSHHGLNLSFLNKANKEHFKNFITPRYDEEIFIKSALEEYKRNCSDKKISPLIISETYYNYGLRPYLGAAYAGPGWGISMNNRYFDADNSRIHRFSKAIIFIIYQNESFLTSLKFFNPADYRTCFNKNNIKVLCSIKLIYDKQCAEPIYNHNLIIY